MTTEIKIYGKSSEKIAVIIIIIVMDNIFFILFFFIESWKRKLKTRRYEINK